MHGAEKRRQLVPERVKPTTLPFPHHVRPEEQARFVCVVGAAAQLDVLDCRRSAHGIGLHMVELQERARLVGDTANGRVSAVSVAPDANHLCILTASVRPSAA